MSNHSSFSIIRVIFEYYSKSSYIIIRYQNRHADLTELRYVLLRVLLLHWQFFDQVDFLFTRNDHLKQSSLILMFLKKKLTENWKKNQLERNVLTISKQYLYLIKNEWLYNADWLYNILFSIIVSNLW